jgi:hypothetical protein
MLLRTSVVEGGTVVGRTSSTPRPLRVEALEASILRVVGLDEFENLVLRNPTVGVRLYISFASG